MTARPRASQLSSVAPASQNTAPVNEFRCLFTHDIRRKQKRWQDGYLKFHTFNNRVMVYDQARNFLGDTYWKEPSELQEGDELQLDKPVMVEVAEALGTTQTDLTQLLEKKKDAPQSKSVGPRQNISQKPMPVPTALPRAASQLRHKSLNTLLGTPRGPIGKATPIESPFEMRKKKESQQPEERALKRQKKAHTPVEDIISSPIIELNTTTKKPIAPLVVTRDPRPLHTPGRQLQREAPVVDVGSDRDEIMSDVSQIVTPPPKSKPPKIPKGKVPVPHVKAMQTPKPPPPPSSPPVSASNRIANIDYALQPSLKGRIELDLLDSSNATDQMEQLKAPSPPPQKTKTLRLTTGVKRGMLLCQPAAQRQDTTRPKRAQTAVKTVAAVERKMKTKSKPEPKPDKPEIIVLDNDDDDDDDMMNNLSSSMESIFSSKLPERTATTKAAKAPKKSRRGHSPEAASENSIDMEITHGFMDQRLAVVPPPPGLDKNNKQRRSLLQGAKVTEPAIAANADSEGIRYSEDFSFQDVGSKSIRTKTATAHKSRKGSPRVTDDQLTLQGVLNDKDRDSARKANQEAEPTKGPMHDMPACKSHKDKPLSLGGFRKKSKRIQSPAAPDESSKHGSEPTKRDAPVTLPNPPNNDALADDPIQDDIQIISPNRVFRRSRSENDAPIPSISEEWEKQNLPNPPLKDSNTVIDDEAHNISVAAPVKPKAGGLAALVKRTDPRRKFQRTKSLNDDAGASNMMGDPGILDLPPDDDVGPWSTEAFDLFDWRPPVAEGEEEDRGTGLLTDRR